MEQDYWDTPEGRAEMADEADLPEHKRSGYAERMNEQADIRRKELRETF